MSKSELEQKPVDLLVQEEEDGSGYVDRTYFRQQRGGDSEFAESRPHPFGSESAANAVTEVREMFNINQYSGGSELDPMPQTICRMHFS